MQAGKKGQYSQIELWFLVAAFILASVAGIDLLRDTSQSLKGTLLEKNFIARDLAMAVEATYASPGDIDFVYNLGGYYYDVMVGSGKVSVKDGDGEVSYRIIGVSAIDEKYKGYGNPEGLKTAMGDFKVFGGDESVKKCKKPIGLVISKKFKSDRSSSIFFSGSNVKVCEMLGEEALKDTCKGVVACE